MANYIDLLNTLAQRARDSYLQKKLLIVRTTQMQGECLEALTTSQMNRQDKKH